MRPDTPRYAVPGDRGPPVSARPNKLVGARVRRREDPKFLRGRGRYTGDAQPPGMLQVAFFRSDVPHANIVDVAVEPARDVPGVVGVFTADDISRLVRPISVEVTMPGYQGCDYPVLGRDKVCFVGQPVAAVVAPNAL